MKTIIKLIASFSVLAIILVAIRREDTQPIVVDHPLSEASFEQQTAIAQLVKTTGKKERKSITFIMGSDKKASNPYYHEAMQYYRHHPQERTDVVNNDCRSLEDVQRYLRQHPPANGQPWGNINIVVHSNEWMGMSIPVAQGGPRATPLLIDEAVAEGTLEPIDRSITDTLTSINMLGCGLGQNTEMIDALQQAFRWPNVQASPYFVHYQSEQYNGQVVQVEKQLLKSYYAFFKTGYRPGDIRLSRQLQRRYPDATIDWRIALQNKPGNGANALSHYTFRVPIVWTVTYADKAERPNLKTKEEQQAWLSDQEELQLTL
ncbi:MAG: hypothetical protein AAFO94_21885, partial [Bacteroidota bacterium]